MKKGVLSFLLAIACIYGAAAKQDTDPVLMTVDKKPVKLSEFEYLYKKNNAQQTTVQPIDEYLNMFVIYKLKVAAAEAEGIGESEAFRNELAGYERDLAEPYLTDPEANENLIKLIYDRLKEEVDVSHIMVKLAYGTKASAAQKAMLDSLRTEILAGRADFAEVADKYSIDPRVNRDHGHMGYISACRYPYTFEDAAYDTPVGEISPVIETPFGYHIVKINARRPSPGQVKVQHILKLTRGLSDSEAAAKKAEIDSIYNVVIAGADFAEVAKSESEDPGSARKGGLIDWFGSGQMVPEFEETSFALNPGEISEPFATTYGYHIVRCLEKRGLESYEVLAPRIAEAISHDERQYIPIREKTRQLREKYATTVDNVILDEIHAKIASGLDSTMVADLCGDTRKIIELRNGDASATVADIFAVLPTKFKGLSADDASAMIDSRIEELANETTLNYERANLVNENAEYRNLLNEYRDGMLLFEISDRNVWSRSKSDPEGLTAFFNDNRAKYATWDAPKFKGYIIFATSDSIKNAAMDYLAKNTVDRQDLVDTMRKLYGKNVKVERVLAAKGENAIIDGIAFGSERPRPTTKWVAYFPYDYSVIDQPEEPADVRGTVTADYQNALEEQWVASLKETYKVKIDKKVLKQFKKTQELSAE